MHAPAPPPIPVETLLMAYRMGIFPMADSRDDREVFWVEPRERAIFPLDRFRPSQSLRKIVRQDRFEVTLNRAFAEVVDACAAPRGDQPDSWISHRIAASYQGLHEEGHAHSIECWRGGALVGGLYGVGFDRVFCGESMFSRADNASKVALVWLVALLRRAGAVLLDCQFMTPHLASLGAVAMPQAEYLALLEAARGDAPLTLAQAWSSLLAGEAAGDGAADGRGDGEPDGEGVGAGSSSPGKLIAQSFTQTS